MCAEPVEHNHASGDVPVRSRDWVDERPERRSEPARHAGGNRDLEKPIDHRRGVRECCGTSHLPRRLLARKVAAVTSPLPVKVWEVAASSQARPRLR